MGIKIIETNGFTKGTIDIFDGRDIPRNAASASLNWLTKGDRIEIRPGQTYLGSASVNLGNGKATGLKKCTDALGNEVLFGSYGKKAKYFDSATQEWIENGTDLLGVNVVDSNGYGIEAISMTEYVTPAGNQMFLTSPNCAGLFKILVANPGTSLNVYSAMKNFKGQIKTDTNRMFLWSTLTDKTGLYGSYIDNQTYTTVTAEAVGMGNSVITSFSHTLAQATGTQTVFSLVVTAGTETFRDDFAGHLIGSAGATGTINYITGALVLTFVIPPPGAITVDYSWEDSNAKGVTDFTKTSPIRLAGQGFVFRQDEGGGTLENVSVYNSIYYCLHLKKTWALVLGRDDTSATNLPYRELVGIPNIRASVETGEGIYYVDTSNSNDVKLRLLSYSLDGSQQVVPVPISNKRNLNGYNFDLAASFSYGDLVLFACATQDSNQVINGSTVPLNNRVIVYNRLFKSLEELDYGVTCFEVYNGMLIGGDSFSNNFIVLFSGYDDFDAPSIDNYWIGSIDRLQEDGQGMHEVKYMLLRGYIAPDQKIKVSLAQDSGAFVEVGASDSGGVHTYTIEGGADYVDPGNAINIGDGILGSHTIGGSSSGATQAYYYERWFRINTSKFEFIEIKFEAVSTGYASVLTQKWWDVRNKGVKVPRKYRG